MRKIKITKERGSGGSFSYCQVFLQSISWRDKKIFHGRFPMRAVPLILFSCSLFVPEFRLYGLCAEKEPTIPSWGCNNSNLRRYKALYVQSELLVSYSAGVTPVKRWHLNSCINKAVEETSLSIWTLSLTHLRHCATDFYSSKAAHGTQQLSSQTTSRQPTANCST